MQYNIKVDVALPKIKAANILQAFRILATEMSAITGASEQYLLDNLIEKEASEISASGKGVAVPHLQSKAIPERFVALATLDRPIHLDTPDGQAVDLICLLLSPDSDGGVHLRGLSRLSRLLNNEELCQVLRETDDPEAMKALFINPEGWLMAA